MKEHRILCLLSFAAGLFVTSSAARGQELVVEVSQLAASAKHGLILEVGCEGQGELALALARAIPSYRVYAASWDDARVEAARRKIDDAGLYGRVAVNHAGDDGLPFPDKCMNILLCAVGEMKGQGRLQECLRVLRPGGTAILHGEVNTDELRKLLRQVSETHSLNYELIPGKTVKVKKGETAGAGEWSQVHGDATNRRVGDDRLLAPPLKVAWMRDYWKEVPGEIHCKFAHGGAIANQNVLVFSDGNNRSQLMVVDSYNGITLWKHKDCPIRILAGEKLYLADGGQIFVWNALRGEQEECYKLPADAKGPLLSLRYADRTLFGLTAGDGNGFTAFALEAATGKALWAFQATGPAPSNAYEGRGLCVGDQRVFFANKAGKLWALQSANGKELWSNEVATGKHFKLFLAEGRLYFVSLDNTKSSVRTMDPKDGREIWDISISGFSIMPVVVFDGVAFLSDTGFKLRTFDTATGRELYRTNPSLQGWGCNDSSAANGYVIRRCFALVLFSGREKSYQVYPSVCPSCFGTIVANGMLYAFRPGVYALSGGGTAPGIRNPQCTIQESKGEGK